MSKIRHVVDGHIIDATVERANQAMFKLGTFNPMIDDQIVSLDGQGMAIGQGTHDSLIFLDDEGWIIASRSNMLLMI